MKYYKNLKTDIQDLQYIPNKLKEIEYHKEQIEKFKKQITEIRMGVFQCLYPGMEVNYDGDIWTIAVMGINGDPYMRIIHKDKNYVELKLEDIDKLEFDFEEE